MDERDRVVGNGDIGPWASLSADRVEEILLMVSRKLNRFGWLSVLDPPVPLTINLQFPSLADEQASLGSVELSTGVAIVGVVG